jgi:hypothetical protein
VPDKHVPSGNFALVKISREKRTTYDVLYYSDDPDAVLAHARSLWPTHVIDGESNALPGTTVRTAHTFVFDVWGTHYIVNPATMTHIKDWSWGDRRRHVSRVGDAILIDCLEGGAPVIDDTPTPMPQLWQDIEKVVGNSRRVLLWGPPGTGKTYTAMNHNLNGRATYSITLTEETPMFELRGTYMPNERGGVSWLDGIGITSWRDGARIVINELDHAGSDSMSFLHALLDDPEFARFTLPKFPNEDVFPSDGFEVVATMNGHPDDLPEALRDRFPVCIKVDQVHPAALDKLSPQLRKIAAQSIVAPRRERIGYRRWLEFDSLMQNKTVGVDTAARVVLGDATSSELIKSLKVAMA